MTLLHINRRNVTASAMFVSLISFLLPGVGVFIQNLFQSTKTSSHFGLL